MLRMIQGIDQRLDALLCGRMLSDGKGVFLGVMSDDLVDRSRVLVDEALLEFNSRGGVQLSLNRNDDAAVVDPGTSASVYWRYWLEIDAVRGRFYIELLDYIDPSGSYGTYGEPYLLRFVDHGAESHTKFSCFNELELNDGRRFKSVFLQWFETVIGWSRYYEPFVASWNEFSSDNELVSVLSVKEQRHQLGTYALEEFTFKYRGQDRFFIELGYRHKIEKLNLKLQDAQRNSHWRDFPLDAGSPVSEIMPGFLQTVEAWFGQISAAQGHR